MKIYDIIKNSRGKYDCMNYGYFEDRFSVSMSGAETIKIKRVKAKDGSIIALRYIVFPGNDYMKREQKNLEDWIRKNYMEV